MNTTPPTAEELATLMQSADTLRSVAEQASRADELEKENERLKEMVARQCKLLNDASDAIDSNAHFDIAERITRMRETLKTAQEGNRNYAANVERLKQERDNWKETADRQLNNAQYYYNLLQRTAEHLGEEVYVCDDGSRSVGPLVAKVPELVERLSLVCSEVQEQCSDLIRQRVRSSFERLEWLGVESAAVGTLSKIKQLLA